MSGGSSLEATGSYGTMLVGAPNNVPGARVNHVTWYEPSASGTLWMFGGNGFASSSSRGTVALSAARIVPDVFSSRGAWRHVAHAGSLRGGRGRPCVHCVPGRVILELRSCCICSFMHAVRCWNVHEQDGREFVPTVSPGRVLDSQWGKLCECVLAVPGRHVRGRRRPDLDQRVPQLLRGHVLVRRWRVVSGGVPELHSGHVF